MLILNYNIDRELISIITPENFKPRPKVDSALINLIPKISELNTQNEELFLNWSQLFFQHRRKTLTNGIKQHYPDWYKKSGISIKKTFGMRRAENLEFEEWLELFKCYIKNERFKTFKF